MIIPIQVSNEARSKFVFQVAIPMPRQHNRASSVQKFHEHGTNSDLLQWIPDIFNVRGTTVVFLIIELSYIRVLKGVKLTVGTKIRIDYKPVFLISEFFHIRDPLYNFCSHPATL